MVARFVEHGQDLLPLHAGKAFQKVFDRVAGLDVIKEALNRHTRADKNRSPSQDVGIGADDVGYVYHFHTYCL